jgi:hypothetical protein
MSLETLNKDDLVKILRDKQIVFNTTVKTNMASERFMFDNEMLHALQNARCRLCVGETFEVPDETTPVGKRLVWLGQPISESNGGDQPACRTCVHIRMKLAEQGIRDVYV